MLSLSLSRFSQFGVGVAKKIIGSADLLTVRNLVEPGP